MIINKTFNPGYAQRINEYLKRQKFMHHINFKLTKIDAGVTEGELEVIDIHKQQAGLIHGGVIATAADIVAGFAAYSLVAPEDHVVTGEIKISYLRPGKGDKLYAKGWVIKSGKRLSFCEAEVFTESAGKKTLIARATTTMITV